MTNMDELAFALKMRDIVGDLVAEELQKRRPRYRYATVTSVTPASHKANIIFNGDTDPVTVATGHFTFVKVGNVVRIDGIGANKFISDIINGDGSEQSPSGSIAPFAGFVTPAGWLICDGSQVSRATYPSLFAALNPLRTIAASFTSGTPGLITMTAHGYKTQQIVWFETGSLPAGITAGTHYYVINVSANTFRLATSAANADAGTGIAFTTSTSGTIKIHYSWGSGDGSTTFHLPNFKGRTLVGIDPASPEFAAPYQRGGQKTVVLTAAEMPSHTHIQDAHNHTQGSHSHGIGGSGNFAPTFPAADVDSVRLSAQLAYPAAGSSFKFMGTTDITPSAVTGGNRTENTDSSTATNNSSTATNQNTGGGGAHDNLPPYVAINYIIKV